MNAILSNKYKEFFKKFEDPMVQRVLLAFCQEYPEYGNLYSNFNDFIEEVKKDPNKILFNIIDGYIEDIQTEIHYISNI